MDLSEYTERLCNAKLDSVTVLRNILTSMSTVFLNLDSTVHILFYIIRAIFQKCKL